MTGKTVSHYTILGKIGEGGMGVVYEAEDTKLHRTVALKFLRPDAVESEEQKTRFLHEAEAAAALNHPNVCTVYDVDEAEGQSFIAMERIEGQSLSQKIKQRPLPLEEALNTAIQIAEGLQAAHRKEIVHRDVKSANIMIDAEGRVKIMDFGMAHLGGHSRITRTGTSLGTPAYMAPEQVRGEPVDRRADIWSLGVVIYEMISGRLPFAADSAQAVMYSILTNRPEPPTALRTGLPVAIDRIIGKALAKDPADRYQHVEDLAVDLRALRAPAAESRASREPAAHLFRRPLVAVVTGATLLAAALAGGWLYYRYSKARWARFEALPRIEQLIEREENEAAFQLVQQAERYIPGDPALDELRAVCSLPVTVRTNPPGAEIYLKRYGAPEGEWRRLGQSPIENIRVAHVYRHWRFTLGGYAAAEMADRFIDLGLPGMINRQPVTIAFEMQKEGSFPTGMVRVPSGPIQFGLYSPTLPLINTKVDSFFLDKYEVTNRDYKAFVDAGGYTDSRYWKHEFVKQGRAVSWEQAMSEFRDRTGQPGPASWELGTYPEGKDNVPVGGVSWYEAAAFAEFRGKSLPTIFHWFQAASVSHGSLSLPLSNFGGEGPAEVGSHRGMSPFGIYDMAGNVKEWCWNATGDQRYILGGGWAEEEYMYGDPDARPPFDRSPANGFRCMQYQGAADRPGELGREVKMGRIDYRGLKPVGDEVFKIYRRLHDYDRTELNARVEEVDESPTYWTREKISFDAAYGNERMSVHLFRPKQARPPFQAVVHFPGSWAFQKTSTEMMQRIRGGVEAAIIRSGRVLVWPVYKGSFERADPAVPFMLRFRRGDVTFRDTSIMMVKDARRSVDYLESRQDILAGKLAFAGASLGVVEGINILACEERFRASLFRNGGLPGLLPFPEIDPFNFVSRIRVPVLMVNGRFDNLFPVDASQLPCFRLLGTPMEHKKHVLLERSHTQINVNDEIRETLAWLDRYLGPVENPR